MTNSPFLGTMRVKATTTAKSFPAFRTALDTAFYATLGALLIAGLHSYFRHNGFHESSVVTLAIFGMSIYIGFLLSWWLCATILDFIPRFNLPISLMLLGLSTLSMLILPTIALNSLKKLDILKDFIDLDKATTKTNALMEFASSALHLWWPTGLAIPLLLAIYFYRRTH